jgi:hypothetical protein
MAYNSSFVPGDARAVTKSDSVSNAGAAVYVGGTGDVAIESNQGSITVFKAVPAGTVLWVGFTKIRATGTTATDLVALS